MIAPARFLLTSIIKLDCNRFCLLLAFSKWMQIWLKIYPYREREKLAAKDHFIFQSKNFLPKTFVLKCRQNKNFGEYCLQRWNIPTFFEKIISLVANIWTDLQVLDLRRTPAPWSLCYLNSAIESNLANNPLVLREQLSWISW